MVEQSESTSSDSQVIVKSIIDIIINNLFKRVQLENKDFDFGSLEVPVDREYLRANFMSTDDIPDDTSDLKKDDRFNVNTRITNTTKHPKQLTLLHSMVLPTLSQQGDGDSQSKFNIKNNTSSHHMELESEISRHNYRNTSLDFITTQNSNTEVKTDFQDSFYKIKFDDETCKDRNTNCTNRVKAYHHYSYGNIEHQIKFHPNELSLDSGDTTRILHGCSGSDMLGEFQHPTHFCQYNNEKYLSNKDSSSQNEYCAVIDQNYDNYKTNLKDNDDKETDELLSVCSQDLNTIEENSYFVKTNPFINPFLNNIPNITEMGLSWYSQCTSLAQLPDNKENNSVKVVADTKNIKGSPNWEEVLEVQMNVTDPVDILEITNEYNNCDSIVQRSEFLSNVGFISEQKINPKYLGPVDNEGGLESIKYVSHVQERHISPNPEKIVCIIDPSDLKESSSSNVNRDFDHVNYLKLLDQKDRDKKNNLAVRLSRTISRLFRQKKKNVKT